MSDPVILHLKLDAEALTFCGRSVSVDKRTNQEALVTCHKCRKVAQVRREGYAPRDDKRRTHRKG